MIKPLKEILIQIEATVKTGSEFEPAATKRNFVISMTSYASHVVMPALVPRLEKYYPNIVCDIEEISSDTITRIKNGVYDFCITFLQPKLLNPKESLDELNYAPVYSDRWALVCDIKNDLVTESMSFEDFCRLPFAEVRPGGVSSLVERTLDQKKMRPTRVVSITSFDLAITSVIGSDCVAVVPSRLITNAVRPLLKVVEPPFHLPVIEEYLVWHTRNDAESGHRWFRDIMLEIARELRPASDRSLAPRLAEQSGPRANGMP